MVILLALVPGIALLRLVIWLLTPERDKDESESNYWRIHGNKNVARTQEIVCAFSPASPQFLRPSTDGLHAEQEHGTKKGLAMRD